MKGEMESHPHPNLPPSRGKGLHAHRLSLRPGAALGLTARLLLLVLSVGMAPAETLMVPMRDGTRLAAEVYLPQGEGPFPAVLMRSTYGRKIAKPEDWTKDGYALVVQDVRGRGDSEGKDDAFFADGWRSGLQDGADTVSWVEAQAWCDGKIASCGGSALGVTQVLMAPATGSLACQSIDVAASNFYGQLAYQGGAFRKRMCEGWLTMQKIPHVIDLWKSHPSYDSFWRDFNAEAKAEQVTAPGLHVGGWQDIFAVGTLQNFVTRQHRGGPGARGNQKLIMKWSPHGPDVSPDFSWPENRFDVKVSRETRRFIDYWCKGKDDGIMREPAVRYYAIGDDSDPKAPGMQWRTAADWPPFPVEEISLYLTARGLLSLDAPQAKGSSVGFVYDPTDPFPTLGGANLILPSGPYDQRKVNFACEGLNVATERFDRQRTGTARHDLLKFATKPLKRPVEVTGHIAVALFASTDCPDTDFTAKLIDVYPKGDEREILVVDNIQRVKYRRGFEKPCPLLESPEEIVKVEIDLWSTCWIFNAGHRIGLQISSSNYPRFEKNPNTGEDFPPDETSPEHAVGKGLRLAHNVIYMGLEHPSALILSVREGEGL